MATLATDTRAYSHCPCVFKTWNALHNHLSRHHANQTVLNSDSVVTFSCHLCACKNISFLNKTIYDTLCYLKNHKAVHYIFEGFTFQTNVYGTFNSHKNRKHNPYTLKDFKISIVKTNLIQISADCRTDDGAVKVGNSNADSDRDIEIETEPQDLP